LNKISLEKIDKLPVHDLREKFQKLPVLDLGKKSQTIETSLSNSGSTTSLSKKGI
jgi:hypothetical protein